MPEVPPRPIRVSNVPKRRTSGRVRPASSPERESTEIYLCEALIELRRPPCTGHFAQQASISCASGLRW